MAVVTNKCNYSNTPKFILFYFFSSVPQLPKGTIVLPARTEPSSQQYSQPTVSQQKVLSSQRPPQTLTVQLQPLTQPQQIINQPQVTQHQTVPRVTQQQTIQLPQVTQHQTISAPIVTQQQLIAPIVTQQISTPIVTQQQTISAPIVAQQQISASILDQQQISAPIVTQRQLSTPIVNQQQQILAPIVAQQQQQMPSTSLVTTQPQHLPQQQQFVTQQQYQQTDQPKQNHPKKQLEEELPIVSPEVEDPNEPKTLIFVENLKETIYGVLKPKELEKIIHCRYCSRKFTFLSEHLSHLKKHTHDVDSVVEMSIKIWVPDRRLKCDKCKFKTSYTLDYAKHRDTHQIKGLACSKCQCEVSNPKSYGEHMEIHHPSILFSEEPSKSDSMASSLSQGIF